MMILNSDILKEIKKIAIITLGAICVMIALFAVCGYFSWGVVVSGFLGGAVAILNFFFLAVTVEKSRQVQDGYDTHTDYDDNGDGTFTEREVQTPRYKTEYYTEEEEQPVYEKVPRYQTKYYYDIDKWVPDRTLETSGGADEPYWDDTKLGENEREGDRRAEYKVTLTTDKDKSYTAEVEEELWNSLDLGDNVDIVVKSGRVTSINGTEL